MAYEFHLPDIGEGLDEAEVVRWLVSLGDHVVTDAPLAEVETDKAVVEMPAPATGTVVRLGAQEGQVVKVGQLFVVIDDGSAAGNGGTAGGDGTAGNDGAGGGEAADHRAGLPATPAARSRPKATPATRRRARELGVDLAAVTGSGPGGRITDSDVEAAVAGAEPPSESTTRPAGEAGAVPGPRRVAVPTTGEDRRIALRGLRRRTMETMTESWRSIPHIVGFQEADASELLALRARLRPRAESAGVALTLTPFLVKATGLALARHPLVNSSLDEPAAEIVVRHRRNVGVAVATDDGLVVPVVTDADTKPLLAIAREVGELTAAARARTVDLAALRGGTFTITNHGPLGGWIGTPIIKPPEAGILGFGRAADRPVAVDGRVEVRPVLPLSMGADHRIVDGDLMLAFLTTVRELLADPLLLLFEDG